MLLMAADGDVRLGGTTALSTCCCALVGGRHGGVEGGEVAHHGLVLVLLIGVDRLRVLAEVVEAGKLFSAMAGEGTFAGVFPRAR